MRRGSRDSSPNVAADSNPANAPNTNSVPYMTPDQPRGLDAGSNGALDACARAIAEIAIAANTAISIVPSTMLVRVESSTPIVVSANVTSASAAAYTSQPYAPSDTTTALNNMPVASSVPANDVT